MVGREVKALFAHRQSEIANDVALRVESLKRRGNARDRSATVLDDVSFEVRRGEILGVAGLVGAGRTEMARAVFGADPFASGRVIIEGRQIHIRSPQDAIRHGIGLVPEDRKQQALFLAPRCASILVWHRTGRSCAGAFLSTRPLNARWSRNFARNSISAWRARSS